MKNLLLGPVAVALVATFASASAHATTITWINDSTTIPTSFITAPIATSPGGTSFTLSTTGSVTNQQASPFGDSSTPYSCLDCIMTPPGGPDATATYAILPGAGGFSLFWGSPDPYNSITFVASDGGPNVTITGDILGVPVSTGHDLVQFAFNGNKYSEAIFEDTGTAAFEYSDVTSTPLPAALPLFMGGLGILGFVGRRRKRQTAVGPI